MDVSGICTAASHIEAPVWELESQLDCPPQHQPCHKLQERYNPEADLLCSITVQIWDTQKNPKITAILTS
jgi:hypothetical protein